MKPGKRTSGTTGGTKGARGRGAPRAAGASRASGAAGAAGAAGRPARGSGGSGAAGGARQYASRGAARTGRVRAPGDTKPAVRKTLGGEQIEGRQAVRELLIAGTRRVDLDESETVNDIVEIAHHERVPVQHVARKRLEAAARSEAPQGVIAYADPVPEADLSALLRRIPGRVPFLVAVDGVTDPGNLGALLRCCDGAGVDGVVLPRHRAVHVTPTVAKAAAGAVEHVKMTLVGGLPAALAQMKEAGLWIVGLDDAADRELFDLGDLARDAICIVMGAEGAGLSRLVRERCDLIVSIPMLGRLSSLNVSAAAALATYEVSRARRPR